MHSEGYGSCCVCVCVFVTTLAEALCGSLITCRPSHTVCNGKKIRSIIPGSVGMQVAFSAGDLSLKETTVLVPQQNTVSLKA